MLSRCIGVLILLFAHGCTSPAQRIDRLAEEGRLARSVVTGTDYRHVVYRNAAAAAATGPLLVYLEGDGRPWGDRGQVPASDPTTAKPIGLRLLIASPMAGVYVSRPCYQQMLDPPCTAAAWTDSRYADGIVDSMVAAIGRVAAGREITLIGYSGGGTLAVLIGERLADVRSVVTIGANLDTGAWTKHHGYLALDASINPAASTREHPWNEIHLQGVDDEVVPPATTDGYFARYPAAQRSQLDDFGHVCCWVERWPALLKEALDSMGESGR